MASLAMTRRKPIDVICEAGDLAMLKYYLPLHLEHTAEINRETTEEESSLFTSKRSKLKGIKFMTPGRTAIQRACELQQIEIVKYLYTYFANKTPPPEFDVHFWDENTGENCALVAVRIGSIELITYLHEECGASFSTLNRLRENAIQVLTIAAKRRPQPKFLHCMKYLVEKVGVDISHNYEEVLLSCNDEEMVLYIESRLNNQGIVVTKSELEEVHSSEPRAKRQDSTELRPFDDRSITDILQSLKDEQSSFCSTIRHASVDESVMTANMSLDYYH